MPSARAPHTEPRDETLVLHGHTVSYRTAGSGPVLLLVHGITGSCEHWRAAIPPLAERFTVVAPDLLGHGRSAKPRGDYSLGAYAAGLRDLMLALGHERVTVVGHSLGGGVAMQFAYQFPERCERLVLVSSGGLGREVHALLRSAALPGAELVLPLISNGYVARAGAGLAGALDAVGVRPGSDLAEIARGFASLGASDARHAFLMTLRGLVDVGGQRVNATDRLYLAGQMATLIVWGRRDPIIPVVHGEAAHDAMPGSRLEVFERAGHFPQLDDPVRFARLVTDFVLETEPAEIDLGELRERLLAGQPT
jgi:pimeloyl-ACP methyl ester carboxylesterase